MSPRRRFDDSVDAGAAAQSPADTVHPDYFRVSVKPPRRWGLPLIAVLAAAVLSATITASILMLARHEADRRAELDGAAALVYVREFMTAYMTIDPSNAQAYADDILARGTGEFAKMFQDKRNEILARVARSEAVVATVLEAGVQRRNGDGSLDVLLAAKVATATPDGSPAQESVSRWVATAIKQGQQWKISSLIQVI